MPDYSKSWSKQQLTVNSATWTIVSPPFSVNYFAVKCNTSDLLIRSNMYDPTTEDTLLQYTQDSVTVPFTRTGGQGCRFKADIPIFCVKSIAPSATIILTWVK